MLSLKEKHTPEVQRKLQECIQLGSRKGPNAPASVPDVEEVMNKHVMLNYDTDKFKFECTGCGECCRTADHIMLSPYDLFTMTRTGTMQFMGVQNTMQMRQHR